MLYYIMLCYIILYVHYLMLDSIGGRLWLLRVSCAGFAPSCATWHYTWHYA